jgi:hypothetical protein
VNPDAVPRPPAAAAAAAVVGLPAPSLLVLTDDMLVVPALTTQLARWC